MSFEWYRSLTEIIGPFENLVQIDRSRLRGADFEPHLPEWHLPGDKKYWQWDSISDLDASGPSPVAQRVHDLAPDDPEAVKRIISEALLVPGETSDYHFALLGAYETLWQMRRQDPSINKVVESLCLLDVRLVEARPKAVQMSDDDPDSFVLIPAFHHLISLYREEGFLAEAIEIAEKAERFGQGKDLESLRERMAVLEAEGA